MVKLVLASNNQGKIREIRQLVHETNIEIILQTELGVPEAEETGQTFIENALLKARQAAAMTSLPAIADDSGLVVPALNGEPGIFSARYAGEGANPQKNIEKLLKNLAIPLDVKREAYFYCVIVLLRHATDPCPVICEGKWEGKILSAARGNKGFGYDPIFFDETYQCSAAQLPLAVKNKISHRGQAMSKLLHFIAVCYD
jgi:XTP/dITP diphosphohydrolase